MSADNYLFVRKRADGRFGISHRSASTYYADEDGPSNAVPPPDDKYGIFDTAEDAILAAHREEAKLGVVEYGVCLGAGVL